MNRIAIGIIVALVLSSAAVATPIIVVGDRYLLPDQAGQEIGIYVTGADPVQGLEFNVQIGEGVSGPVFETIDIFTGTIFEANNVGIYPGSYINLRDAYQGTVTVSDTVLADGLLATLTLDTTGIFNGQYTLSLIDTLEGCANFAGLQIDITDGTIFVELLNGDRDGDGFVGQDDLDIVLGEWGDNVVPDSPPDPSGDGFVGQEDLDAVLGDWGKGGMPAPEPATMIFLAVGAFGLLSRRCKTRPTGRQSGFTRNI